jgi:DNA modification methylase
MDKRKIDGVDIVHDPEIFPYPIGDEECITIFVKRFLSRMKPWLTIDWFNEMWRILKPHGQLAISVPYAGSPLYWSDPGSCNGFTERTFSTFVKGTGEWDAMRSKPWSMTVGHPMWQVTGVIEAVLIKEIE